MKEPEAYCQADANATHIVCGERSNKGAEEVAEFQTC